MAPNHKPYGVKSRFESVHVMSIFKKNENYGCRLNICHPESQNIHNVVQMYVNLCECVCVGCVGGMGWEWKWSTSQHEHAWVTKMLDHSWHFNKASTFYGADYYSSFFILEKMYIWILGGCDGLFKFKHFPRS